MNTLGSICEPNLRNAFSDFFESLREENCDLRATGDMDNPEISLEIIDFQMLYGSPFISREECRLTGLREMSYGLPPNTQLLIPQNLSVADLSEMRLNLQYLVKV